MYYNKKNSNDYIKSIFSEDNNVSSKINSTEYSDTVFNNTYLNKYYGGASGTTPLQIVGTAIPGTPAPIQPQEKSQETPQEILLKKLLVHTELQKLLLKGTQYKLLQELLDPLFKDQGALSAFSLSFMQKEKNKIYQKDSNIRSLLKDLGGNNVVKDNIEFLKKLLPPLPKKGKTGKNTKKKYYKLVGGYLSTILNNTYAVNKFINENNKLDTSIIYFNKTNEQINNLKTKINNKYKLKNKHMSYIKTIENILSNIKNKLGELYNVKKNTHYIDENKNNINKHVILDFDDINSDIEDLDFENLYNSDSDTDTDFETESAPETVSITDYTSVITSDSSLDPDLDNTNYSDTDDSNSEGVVSDLINIIKRILF